MISNCPNCGAPIVGNKCEYCGTIFNDIRGKYQFNHEQENQYHSPDLLNKLDLLHKLDQLNIEKRNLEFQLAIDKRNLEFQLAYDNCIADTKQKIMNLVYNLK
jgi:hypothetical protein